MERVPFALALGLLGCTGGSGSPRALDPQKPATTVPVPPPPARVTEHDAGNRDAGADAGANAENEPDRIVRASFALRSDLSPCRFVFRAGVGNELDFGRYLMAVERIEVEASETCAAHVVFDAAAETPSDPGEFEGALEGGLLPNPGKLDVAAAQTEGPEPLFVDANFDGYLDLAVGQMSGAYNRSSRFWLFEPATKRFVRSKQLEELLMPRFDAKRKRVEAGGRAGGPVYVGSAHEWVNDKLETVWSETTYLGETPGGKPLPRGFTQYKIRYERRGGGQKKVFEGPAR